MGKDGTVKKTITAIALLTSLCGGLQAQDEKKETKAEHILLDGLTWTYLAGVTGSYIYTKKGQAVGLEEGNPMMHACMESNWCGVPVSSGLSLLLIAGTQQQFKQHHPWRAVVVMGAFAALRGWDFRHDYVSYQKRVSK